MCDEEGESTGKALHLIEALACAASRLGHPPQAALRGCRLWASLRTARPCFQRVLLMQYSLVRLVKANYTKLSKVTVGQKQLKT